MIIKAEKKYCLNNRLCIEKKFIIYLFVKKLMVYINNSINDKMCFK